ncbi:unnamed protein product [Kuraishia capsulata CBS 1993]|uniref:lipoyl(octanoyl) transferase n=1 Tax=Kuraishia capsulata CBS 1993 TaxID=1382522 RepID=W6MX77_9ASCO|nr:uncharacterized protein KUCA_T00004392001 [Kuraishia capsulata CBS 1993]CDK28410.1 unnamed protein product [Kuraishia capsulata CBS 1993]
MFVGFSSRCQLRRRLEAFERIRNYSTDQCSLSSFYPLNPNASTLKHIHFRGVLPYAVGDKIQELIVSRFLQSKKYKILSQNPRKREGLGEAPVKPHPVVLSFEFEPTYTGGKREKLSGSHDYKKLKNVDFVQTDRGGQVTFHGPGQAVLYPLLDLTDFHKLTSKCYISTLEKTIASVLKNSYGLDALTNENTGVWVQGQGPQKKISSIGVNVRRSITSHGVSINCRTDLSYVNDPRIVMCGLENAQQTSIEQEGGKFDNIESISKQVVGEFAGRLRIPNVEFLVVENAAELFETWEKKASIEAFD